MVRLIWVLLMYYTSLDRLGQITLSFVVLLYLLVTIDVRYSFGLKFVILSIVRLCHYIVNSTSVRLFITVLGNLGKYNF